MSRRRAQREQGHPRVRRHPGVRQRAAALVARTRSTAAIVFAVGYWFALPDVQARRPAATRAYEQEMDRAARRRGRDARRGGVMTPRRSIALSKDTRHVARGQAGLHDDLRRVSPRRRRRHHRPEPDRRVLAPRRHAREDLQDGQRRRPRQGHARVGAAARPRARSQAVTAYVLTLQGHQRRRRQGPAGRTRSPTLTRDVREDMHLARSSRPTAS